MGILMLNGNNYTGGIQQVYGKSSGNIATFDDGGDNKPLKSLKVAINPVQSGSGEPSPSNVRPISGWDAVNVTRCGKNLWGGEKLADDIVNIVPNASKDTVNKTVTYTARNVDRIVIFDKFKANTQYTIYLSSESSYSNMVIQYTDNTSDVVPVNEFKTTNANKSVKRIAGNWASGTTVLKYDECGIWEGVIDTFTPYNGTTYTIPFEDSQGDPLTIYGGEIHIRRVNGVWSGEVVETWKSNNLGELDWAKAQSSDQTYYYFWTIPNPSKAVNNNFWDFMCENYKQVQKNREALDNYDIGLFNSNNVTNRARVAIRDDSLSSGTATEFQTAVNNIKIVYRLETPNTYPIDPTNIPNIVTLLGDNNMFADTGDIDEVIYIRDLNLVINQFDARITALEQALNSSGTRSLSLSKSATKEETEEITEEPKEEEQNEDKR